MGPEDELAPEVLLDDDLVPAPDVPVVPDAVVDVPDVVPHAPVPVVAVEVPSELVPEVVVSEPDAALDVTDALVRNTLAVSTFGVDALVVGWATGVALDAGGSLGSVTRSDAVASGS